MGAEASLGTIVRAKGGELLEKLPVNAAQRKVMRAMADCRSAALGGHSRQLRLLRLRAHLLELLS